MTKVEILPWPINAKCSKAETRVARALLDSDLGLTGSFCTRFI